MIKRNNYKKLFYPKNLNISELLIKNDLYVIHNKKNFDKQREYLHIIVDSILRARKTYQIKNEDLDLKDGFPLSSIILKNKIRDYNKYLGFLIEVGFIWQYEDADTERCARYKILEPYKDESLSAYHLFSKSNKKAHKLFEVAGHGIYNSGDASKHCKQLAAYKGLSVDWEDANRILDELYSDDILRRDMVENQLRIIDQYNGSNELRPFFIGITGRLYTPFTNLKKELRKCLRLIGLQLIENDIRNSIPFFGLILMIDCNEESKGNRILRDICIKEKSIGKEGYKGIMLRKKGLENSDDVHHYKDLVCNGTIYSYLSKLWDIELGEAKLKFLTLCNTPPKQLEANKFWNKFKAKFPNVANVVAKINKDFTLTKNQKKKAKIEANGVDCTYALIVTTQLSA